MKMNIKSFSFGEFAAIGTWSIVFGITLYWLPNAPESVKSVTWLIVALFVIYIVCFMSIVKESIPIDNKAILFSILILQLSTAFGLMLLVPLDFLPILTIIWVSILPHFLSFRKAMLVMLVVVVSWFVLYAYRWDNNNVVFYALLYSTFHLFAIFMNFETVKAEAATKEAQRLNKELQAAQNLLSEASRQNERTRIARDLHDLLGHHLTALIINLQVAGHLTEGEAKEKVDQCHSLAKLLLSDVREAVSALRENQELDFKKMVALMAENIPNIKVHQLISADFSLEDMETAKALLSCIQEALTNSMRHSQGTEFWIDVHRNADTLKLMMKDNGTVGNKISHGNGLKGMQERIEALSGKINFETNLGTLVITIELPISGNDDSPEKAS